ncbi:MAG TPA: histidinol dehydrogenase [Solirubrobacterales bacterium]|nr:histidinol dehydrogenase [Solirubrobacterales bacterium]
MRVRRFEWREGNVGAAAAALAREIRAWATAAAQPVDVREIGDAVASGGDAALIELTLRYDATDRPAVWSPRVDLERCREALAGLEPDLRRALEVAAANVREVAEAQVRDHPIELTLADGQRISVREVPVGAAGIYAPGGAIAYPSSLIMGAIPARAAGVGRIVVCTPPRPDGNLPEVMLAAAALCGVDELYAVGGAQAIFAMARGTETIAPVDVIAGPGSRRVQEAKRAVFGEVGIDSIAGPSELMVIPGPDSDQEPLGLDLAAQAEHGDEGLLVVATAGMAAEPFAQAAERITAARPGVREAPLALVEAPDAAAAEALAEAIAPEHLQLDLDRDPAAADRPGPLTRALAARLTTPGCVLSGPCSATAFGDYAAGSNHVLPTGGAGRFCGPLGPGTFRRRITGLELDAAAAGALAPVVDRIAREEGLPVHGESALARAGRESGGTGQDRGQAD